MEAASMGSTVVTSAPSQPSSMGSSVVSTPQSSPEPSSESMADSAQRSLQRGGQSQQEGQETLERALRKFKLSNGQEIDIDDEELERMARNGYDYDQNYEKLESRFKQMNEFVEYLRDNPAEALRRLGHDPKELTRQALLDEIEQEMMDPQEREMREYKTKLEKYERAEQEKRESIMRAQREQEDKLMQENYDKSIRAALEARGLDVNDWTYGSIINKMTLAMNAGFEDIQPEHVIPYIEADVRRQMDSIFNQPLDKIVKMLGQSNIDKLQKLVIQAAKGEQRPNMQKKAEDELVKPLFNDHQKAISLSEWQEEAKRRMRADRGI